MDIVNDLIELQINYNLYNNTYCVDRETISDHLKRTLEHLDILDLSIKTTKSIVDGIYRHPVNIRLTMPYTTDKNIIQNKMLLLRNKILADYAKHKSNRTLGKTKRITKKRARVIKNSTES